MKEVKTNPGKPYSVHSSAGCTVSDDSGWSKFLDAPEDYFTAHGGKVYIDDDAATVRELFKLAPQQKLALLGVLGGNGGLPAGYTRVEYLEGQDSAAQSVSTFIELPWFAYNIGDSWVFEQEQELLPSVSSINIELRSADTSTIRFYRENRYISVGYDSIEDAFETNWGLCPEPEGFNFWSLALELEKITAIVGDFSREMSVSSFKTQATHPVCLFGTNTSSAHYSPWPWHCRKKWFRAWRNGALRYDLIPCLDSTGAPCMFDLVSRKTFYNAGTGDFSYPTESSTYSLRRVLPDWGKLTPTGLRRLYHAPKNYKGDILDYALENGYKPIVEPERPEEGYWAPEWRETEEEIVLEWVETEPPAEESFSQPQQDDEISTTE